MVIKVKFSTFEMLIVVPPATILVIFTVMRRIGLV